MATTGSGTSSAATGLTGSATLRQLITQYRRMLDDVSDQPLWSDAVLTQIIDTVQKRLCATFPIISDRTTSEICSVDLTQGDGLVSLDARITKVVAAWIDGASSPLEIVSTRFMDVYRFGWDDPNAATSGVPSHLVVEGLTAGYGYLHPLLEAATGTMKMWVYRLPLVDLDFDEHADDSLEIGVYANFITHAVLMAAFDIPDSDMFDPKAVERHRVMWEGVDGRGGDLEQIKRLAILPQREVMEAPVHYGHI